jgi:protein ImuB
MPVPRLVTVWCPDWSVTAAGVPDDRPAAVFRANRVVARSPAAIAAGVQQGERRRSAQGACPDMLVLDHDPDRDARAFEPVIRAIAEMAPRLEIVEPGWVCLVARGPSRYFGGDQAMAERMVEIVRPHSRVGVGVADGRAASAIAARLAVRTPSGVAVVPVGGSPASVADLSVAWLRELGEVTPEFVDLLVRLGVRTLGQLSELGAGDVLARFGAEGLHAHRLAGGADTRATAAVDPPPEWWIEEAFLEPVEHVETVVFTAKRLADSLVGQLAAEGRVCTRLVVVIESEHGERSERVWYRAQGLSAHAMVERVRWQLDGWIDQPVGVSGGIVLVRLLPDELRADDGVQVGLWGGRSQADHDAARAIVRLCGIAGDDAVRVPRWAGGRLPTERYRWVPASSVDLGEPSDRLDRGVGPWPGGLPAPSPAVVPDTPVPVEIFDGRGDVVRVTGRGDVSAPLAVLAFPTARHRLVAWAGPWPIDQRWWSPDRSRRLARFQVVTDEGVAHLVGVEQQRWSILATYS